MTLINDPLYSRDAVSWYAEGNPDTVGMVRKIFWSLAMPNTEQFVQLQGDPTSSLETKAQAYLSKY